MAGGRRAFPLAQCLAPGPVPLGGIWLLGVHGRRNVEVSEVEGAERLADGLAGAADQAEASDGALAAVDEVARQVRLDRPCGRRAVRVELRRDADVLDEPPSDVRNRCDPAPRPPASRDGKSPSG